MIDFRQYPELLQLCDGVMLDHEPLTTAFIVGSPRVNRQVIDNRLLLEAGKLEEVTHGAAALVF